jgi:hypothetical protein
MKEHVSEFPRVSVDRYVIVVAPTVNGKPLSVPEIFVVVTLTPSQLSNPVALAYVIIVEQEPTSAFSEIFEGQAVRLISWR